MPGIVCLACPVTGKVELPAVGPFQPFYELMNDSSRADSPQRCLLFTRRSSYSSRCMRM